MATPVTGVAAAARAAHPAAAGRRPLLAAPLADLALLGAGRAGLLAASVASVHAATRALGPQQLGTVHLLLAAIGCVALPVAGCSHFFYRQVMAWQIDGTLAANLRRYALFLAVTALVAAAAAATVVPARWLPAPAGWFALLLAGNLFVATLQQALLHVLNLRRQRVAYVVLGNAVAWGGLALAQSAAASAGALAVHWMAGLLAAQAAALLAAALLVVASQRPARGPARAAATPFTPQAVGRFAWPLVVCLGLYWVQRSLPLPWLAGAADVATVGRYAVATSIGMLAMLSFDTLFRELCAPQHESGIASADPAERLRAWERLADAVVPALAAACICVAAAGSALLQTLADPAFHGAARFVAFGAVCQLLLSLHGLVMLQAASVMDNRALLLPSAAGALVTVLMLQGRWHTDAAWQAALATAAGLLATALLAAWRLRRLHTARWPWRRTLLAAAAAAPTLLLRPGGLSPVATLIAIGCTGAALQAALACGRSAVRWR